MKDLVEDRPLGSPPILRLWLRRLLRALSGADRVLPGHVDRLSNHMLKDIGLRREQARDLFARRRDPRF